MAGKLARAHVLALSLLGACATEVQETVEPVTTGEAGGTAGMAGAGGSLAGAAGKSTSTGGASAGSGQSGNANQGGSSAGVGGAAGSSNDAGTAGQGGAGGNGGVAGAAGAGGKAGAGGAAGTSGGGMAGSGGALEPKPCATAKLVIKGGAASTIENDTLPAAQAWDGDPLTRWASARSEPHWIYVDLGEVAHVSRVRLTWEAAFATVYHIDRASSTNGPWTTMLDVDNGNGGTDDLTTLTAGDGRYIRMFGEVRSTVYGFSLFEVEVFGDLDQACE